MPIVPVLRTPELVRGPRPRLDAPSRAVLASARREIARTPGAFDGPRLFAVSVDPLMVGCFEATYAWRLAHVRLAGPDGGSPLGLGTVAVAVLLFDAESRVLLARRSDAVMTHPGAWALAAEGGVDPGEQPEQAAWRELAEELALDPAALDRPVAPVALMTGSARVGCTIVFAGRLAAEAVPRPNWEYAELRFADPLAPPQDTGDELRALLAFADRHGSRFAAVDRALASGHGDRRGAAIPGRAG